jgi:hypothetical protein
MFTGVSEVRTASSNSSRQPASNMRVMFLRNVGMSESLYDWRFTANRFVLATSPLRLTTSNFIFQLNTCGYSLYVTSSLTRRLVCRLQLLLVLASAVILRSESSGTHDHILLTQIRDSPDLVVQSPYLYPQVQGGPVIPPGTGFPFRRLLTSGCLRTLRRYIPEDCTIARTSNPTKIPYIY